MLTLKNNGPGQLHGGRPPVDPRGLEDEEPPTVGTGTWRAGVHGLAVGQEPGRGENSEPAKKARLSQRAPTALA